jgi:hypothetical protein
MSGILTQPYATESQRSCAGSHYIFPTHKFCSFAGTVCALRRFCVVYGKDIMPMTDNTLTLNATHIASKLKRGSYGAALIPGSVGVVTIGWIRLIRWAVLKVVSL